MNGKVTTKTLEKLRKGDHAAFGEVFIAYFDKVKILIDGYIKSEEDAEELAEDLFANLWENRQCIDINKSFSGFLHTIARNTALNFLRHKYVHNSYVENYTWNEYTSTSEEDLIASELNLLIELTVEKMPRQRKEVYRLSRIEGLDNGEIATRLNTTKRSVETQLSAALKEIRKAIRMYFLFLG